MLSLKRSIIVTDIDGTLISEKTGQLHPIIVPMLRALQYTVGVIVLTARKVERVEETFSLLKSIGLDVGARFREGEVSPLDHKIRALAVWQTEYDIIMVIDNDVDVLRYADSLGISVVLP